MEKTSRVPISTLSRPSGGAPRASRGSTRTARGAKKSVMGNCVHETNEIRASSFFTKNLPAPAQELRKKPGFISNESLCEHGRT